ncbi:hypothetical protein [Nocardia abscessus]|uniref:hypothetical protein n=1 Tax=Nocardia abscessus TaxID=120957 RepID=UPI002458AA62|nr:hypothetical protein [Nocardia abscessus]
MLYLPLFAFGYLILAIVFVVSLWPITTRSSSRWLPVAAALAVVGVGGSSFLFVDTKASGWARFWLEYPAFAAAATVEVPEHGEGDLYGVELPSHLCVVAPNCRIANLGYSNGAPVRYAADYVDVFEETYGMGTSSARRIRGRTTDSGFPCAPAWSWRADGGGSNVATARTTSEPGELDDQPAGQELRSDREACPRRDHDAGSVCRGALNRVDAAHAELSQGEHH